MSKQNKALVVLRCGDSSLHPSWFADGTPAEFDLALSYYGSNPDYADPHARFIHRFKGSKWEGIVDFLTRERAAVSEYEYVWLPDDDIACSVSDINQLFATMKRYGFALAQPSLNWKSYFSYPITLWNKRFRYRETNFVEVMVPCFSRDALELVRDTMKGWKSGWGLDFVWPQRAGHLGKIGILDEVQVEHTRPVGSAGVGGSGKTDPRAELVEVLQANGLPYKIKVTGGLLLDGAPALPEPHVDRVRIFVNSLRGCHPTRRGSVRALGSYVKEHVDWW
jgi:hypothetical protein